VGNATATDIDTVGVIQNWMISSGNVDGVFEIDSASGEIRVLDNTLLNFETTASYMLGLTVEDGANTSATQTVAISVVDENDVPVLVTNLGISVVEGASVTISATELAATDEDELPSQILFSVVSPPVAGRLELTGDPGVSISSFTQDDIDAGRLQYVHDGSEADDSFTFSVSDGSGGTIATTVFSITNLRVNDAPVNAVPVAQTVNEDSPLVFSAANGNSITVSDVDLNGGMIGVRLVATNGTLTLSSITGLTFANGDGDSDTSMVFAGTIADVNAALDGLRFDPTADYNGAASIRIVSRDMGSSGSGGEQVDDDTVNITVAAVNDFPVAADDEFSIDEDNTLTVSAGGGLLANDSDIGGDTLSVISVTGTTSGTLSLNVDGSFVYTPDADFNGTDTFTYRATDGSLQSETRTVTLTVNPVNDVPVSNDESFVMDQLTVLKLDAADGVLINDVDVEADALQAILVDSPENGKLVLNADGSFTYTPTATFFGEDSFTYRANDGSANGTLATVRITVQQTVTSGTMMDPLPVLQSGLESLGDADNSDDDSLQGILQAHHDGQETPAESFEN
jgi:VCBS repeat-containing protein